MVLCMSVIAWFLLLSSLPQYDVPQWIDPSKDIGVVGSLWWGPGTADTRGGLASTHGLSYGIPWHLPVEERGYRPPGPSLLTQ